jgi:hypothetical protein
MNSALLSDDARVPYDALKQSNLFLGGALSEALVVELASLRDTDSFAFERYVQPVVEALTLLPGASESATAADGALKELTATQVRDWILMSGAKPSGVSQSVAEALGFMVLLLQVSSSPTAPPAIANATCACRSCVWGLVRPRRLKARRQLATPCPKGSSIGWTESLRRRTGRPQPRARRQLRQSASSRTGMPSGMRLTRWSRRQSESCFRRDLKR